MHIRIIIIIPGIIGVWNKMTPPYYSDCCLDLSFLFAVAVVSFWETYRQTDRQTDRETCFISSQMHHVRNVSSYADIVVGATGNEAEYFLPEKMGKFKVFLRFFFGL